MNSRQRNTEEFESKGWPTAFLRPSSAAAVCLIIIFLFIIAGFMNLRAVNRTLSDLTSNNALVILKNIQQVSENYYLRLTRIPHVTFDNKNENFLREYGLGISESFLSRIAELTRDIDIGWGSNFFNNDNFHFFMMRENLWLVAFLESSGNIIYKNRPVPDEVINFVKPVLNGKSNLKVNIFNRTENHGWGILALRRKNQNGVIIVGLNEDSFLERCRIFAIKKAVEDIGQGSNIAYFFLQDRTGNLRGIAGDLLNRRLSLFNDNPILNNELEMESRRIRINNNKIFEVTFPLHIQGRLAGVMGLGLKIEGSERIIEKNRNIIVLSTAFLIVIASLSILFLYINQNRYSMRMRVMERRISRTERLSALGAWQRESPMRFGTPSTPSAWLCSVFSGTIPIGSYQ